MKLKFSKKTLRMAAYVGIIGGFALSGVICFAVSQYQRAKYSSSSVVLTGAKSQLMIIGDQTDAESLDKKEWYGDIAEHFETINNDNANLYKATAIPAYILTTFALVAFGLCLKHADKVKEKEEAD